MNTTSFSLLCNIVLVFFSVSLHAQQIEDYFFNDTLYTKHIILGSVYPGGGFLTYEIDDWKMKDLLRSPFMDDLLPQTVFKHIISSNQLKYTLSNELEIEFHVYGFEVFLDTQYPLSELGYSLANKEEITSNYYIIAYFQNSKAENEIRLISYLDDDYNFVSEIITSYTVYSLPSKYKKYSISSASIVESDIPSLLFLERIDQTIIAINNLHENRIVWIHNILSQQERQAVHFITSLFHSLRFLPKYNNILSRRNRYLQDLEESKKNTYLIDEDLIILPSDIEKNTDLSIPVQEE